MSNLKLLFALIVAAVSLAFAHAAGALTPADATGAPAPAQHIADAAGALTPADEADASVPADAATADHLADSSAVRTENIRAKFAYDLDFRMNFDNREYDRSHIFPSHTIFGVRLEPTIGISFGNEAGSMHKLMFGANLHKDFGRGQTLAEIVDEIIIYYNWQRTFGKTDISLYAGIVPKRFMSGEYSGAFVSDSLRWYDNQVEGLLLKFKRPKAQYELGCDWIGKAGETERERFMIFSSGRADLTDLVSLGYAAYMYHFAGSRQAPGVVDNFLLNPRVDLDFARAFPKALPLQRLMLSVGWLQSLQNDRKLVDRYVAPGGLEVVTEVRKWNVGVRNRVFYGQNMMPYYNSVGTGGEKYGSDLYYGDPFYRVRDLDGWRVYDRLEVYYEPWISRYMDIRVAAVFHFSGGFAGWQQLVGVHFNLYELLSK